MKGQIRNLYDARIWIKKLCRTVRVLSCLFMAQMFGEYRHSGWDRTIHYARYTWRGREWIIPTSAAEKEV